MEPLGVMSLRCSQDFKNKLDYLVNKEIKRNRDRVWWNRVTRSQILTALVEAKYAEEIEIERKEEQAIERAKKRKAKPRKAKAVEVGAA